MRLDAYTDIVLKYTDIVLKYTDIVLKYTDIVLKYTAIRLALRKTNCKSVHYVFLNERQ